MIACLFAAALLLASSTAAAQCPCDCDRDGRVGVAEILRGVRFALDGEVSECVPGCAGGAPCVGSLIQCVHAALYGCPAVPTASATPTLAPATKEPTPAPPGSSPTATRTATLHCQAGSCTPPLCNPDETLVFPPSPGCAQLCGVCATQTPTLTPPTPLDTNTPAATSTPAAATITPSPIGPPNTTATATPATTATPTYTRTPTSCRAVTPRAAPVSSPTDELFQEVFFCGIERGASHVDVLGADTNRNTRRSISAGDCPIGCDGSQACFGQIVELAPNTTHHLAIAQNAGICGVLLSVSEDVFGQPLRITQVQTLDLP